MIAEAAVASVNPLAYAGIAADSVHAADDAVHADYCGAGLFPGGRAGPCGTGPVHDPPGPCGSAGAADRLQCDSGAAVQRSDRLFMDAVPRNW